MSPPCYPGYDFMCNNGRCIVPDWKCNGANECGDWTDEIGCDHFIRNTQTAFPSRLFNSYMYNVNSLFRSVFKK